MSSLTGLDIKIREMAGRIRELREIEGLSIAEMAVKTDVSEEEYLQCEQGLKDLHFAFIYRCALAFNVDVTDIIEGSSPKLRSYTVTRSGQGQKIEQAHGLTYFNLAGPFMNRIADPLYVKCKYSEEAEHSDIALTTHEGQECDIVLEGHIKVQIGEHTEVLGPGDSIYYDSDTPHGMIAVNGKDAIFYAIVLKPDIDDNRNATISQMSAIRKADERPDRVYRQYTSVTKNENGTPTKIEFKNTEKFNFAYDVVDAIAKDKPEKLAMLHISKDKTERRFTFTDMKNESARCANYFKSLGIKKRGQSAVGA